MRSALGINRITSKIRLSPESKLTILEEVGGSREEAVLRTSTKENRIGKPFFLIQPRRRCKNSSTKPLLCVHRTETNRKRDNNRADGTQTFEGERKQDRNQFAERDNTVRMGLIFRQSSDRAVIIVL